MSQFDLEQFVTPLTFPAWEFETALDNYDIADPHRRQDEIDDRNTAPIVNAPLYDTSITNPIEKSNIGLTNFPDYSDEVLSDYKMAQMMGKAIPQENIVDLDTAENYVDLDTAENYVDFIKNSIKNIIASENEFNIDNSEIQSRMKTVLGV
jgi:hypothetical protein